MKSGIQAPRKLPVPVFHRTDNRYIEIKQGDTIRKEKTLITGDAVLEDYLNQQTTITFTEDFSDYTKDVDAVVSIYLTDTATKAVAEATINVVEMPFKLVFFKTDHLGSPRMVTDHDGTILTTHDFLAYGEELTDPDFSTNRMKFTGHERDPETGLDYMKARYYWCGRFLQVDPGYDYNVFNPMSFNLYSYVHGNPANSVDVTGKWEEDAQGRITAYKSRKPNDPFAERYRLNLRDGKRYDLEGEIKYVTLFTDGGKPVTASIYPDLSNYGIDRSYNCIGFVFAKAQYWIEPNQVPIILKNEGYYRLRKSELKPGDVIVYSDSDSGTIFHASRVTRVDEDGTVHVEEKRGGIPVEGNKGEERTLTESQDKYRGEGIFSHSNQTLRYYRRVPGTYVATSNGRIVYRNKYGGLQFLN